MLPARYACVVYDLNNRVLEIDIFRQPNQPRHGACFVARVPGWGPAQLKPTARDLRTNKKDQLFM